MSKDYLTYRESYTKIGKTGNIPEMGDDFENYFTPKEWVKMYCDSSYVTDYKDGEFVVDDDIWKAEPTTYTLTLNLPRTTSASGSGYFQYATYKVKIGSGTEVTYQVNDTVTINSGSSVTVTCVVNSSSTYSGMVVKTISNGTTTKESDTITFTMTSNTTINVNIEDTYPDTFTVTCVNNTSFSIPIGISVDGCRRDSSENGVNVFKTKIGNSVEGYVAITTNNNSTFNTYTSSQIGCSISGKSNISANGGRAVLFTGTINASTSSVTVTYS